jgi:hypothetical protein
MKFNFLNFVRPRGTRRSFENRSRHKLKRCSQFADNGYADNDDLTPKFFHRGKHASNDNKVSRDSANFFVGEKGNLEKTKTRIFLVYADKLSSLDTFSTRGLFLDFDLASHNLCFRRSQSAS